ncbi:MAG: hypothetical protein ACFFCQ_02940 [Promethearchaeota archaeon]
MFKGSKKKKADQLLAEGIHLFSKEMYQEAIKELKKAKEIFAKLKLTNEEEICEAYEKLAEGEIFRQKGQFREATASFGRANVLLSSNHRIEESKIARSKQASAMEAMAKKRASAGEFIESARLYESCAAIYETIEQPKFSSRSHSQVQSKDAARARARSYLQRAAAVRDNDFDKAEFLFQALEAFRAAGEYPPLIEAHAYFYKGRALVASQTDEAVSFLARAAEKYSEAGAEKQFIKVREYLQGLRDKVEARPFDYR